MAAPSRPCAASATTSPPTSGSLVTPISFRRSAVADAATQASGAAQEAGARPPRLAFACFHLVSHRRRRLGRRPPARSSWPSAPARLPACRRRRRRRRSRAAAPTGESRNSSRDRLGPRQIRSGRGWLPVSTPGLGARR